MHLIPTIIEKDHKYHYAYDIYSKLLEERIILLTGTIDDAMSSSIIGQLLYLEAKDSHSDIYLYRSWMYSFYYMDVLVIFCETDKTN